MNTTMLILSIISIISYFFSRGFIELGVITYFSKKGYKAYKKQTNIHQRYWLTWLKKNSKFKYLKSEKKSVNYPSIMSVYFYTHITVFISLVITLLIVILVYSGFLDMVCAEVMLPVFLTEVLLSFVIYYLIENYEHRNYHQKRNKR